MLKYTLAACRRIVNDLKLLAHIFTIVVQSFMIVYMTYSAIVNNGSRIINITLGAVTFLNLVVYLITYGRSSKKAKRVKGAVSKGYVIAKLSLNAVSLASIVYSIYVGASNVSSMTMVIAPLMIIMWVLQVALQVAKSYVENRVVLFVDGFQMDFELAFKLKVKANNLVHDFFGEDREDEVIISPKNRKILEEQAIADGLNKKNKRASSRRKFFDAVRSKLTSSAEKDEETV